MSKYDKIFEAREQENSETPSVRKAISKEKKTPTKKAAKPEIKMEAAPVTENAPKRRGRPQAKRSDPNYVGFTTYILKKTHTRAKIALLQEGEGKELSELVEELISGWLNEK